MYTIHDKRKIKKSEVLSITNIDSTDKQEGICTVFYYYLKHMYKQTQATIWLKYCCVKHQSNRGRFDRMAVGFMTTYATSAYLHQCCELESRSGEVYSIQYYVINFVSDLRQFGGFLRVFRSPPPIKLTATI